jgi:hypothetical protein
LNPETVDSLRADTELQSAVTEVVAEKAGSAEVWNTDAIFGSLTVPVEVEILPPSRRFSSSDEDHEPPRPMTPPPSDADEGELEIEAEFRQNLSHLMARGSDPDDIDGENVRLSMIMEENLDLPGIGAVSRLITTVIVNCTREYGRYSVSFQDSIDRKTSNVKRKMYIVRLRVEYCHSWILICNCNGRSGNCSIAPHWKKLSSTRWKLCYLPMQFVYNSKS